MRIRILAAVAALVSAGVHLYLWSDGMRDEHVVGPAFLVNAVAGSAIAVLLVAWRHWVPLFLVAGFGASTLGAFVIASTVGLFGEHESWTGSYVWAAAISEAVAIGAGVWAAVAEGWVPSLRQSEHRFPVGGAHHH